MDFSQFDFNQRPFLVIWETTHACDLECIHCRASAEPNPDPNELTHEEGLRVIREVKEMGTPILIFSGGDPLKRKDLPDLIRYAKSLGLRTGAIPAVTPLLTRERIKELKDCGLDQIAFSLDAADQAEHDKFRKVEGVFKRTLESVAIANEYGLAVQINSLINVHNSEQLDELIKLVGNLKIVFWEVFFLVPTGRGKELPLLVAEKFDAAFEKIYALSHHVKFIVKVTEAPHYRKFYFEKEIAKHGISIDSLSLNEIDMPAFLKKSAGPGGSIGHAPQGVNSGKGFIFISHLGEVMPSGFLPIVAGNVREKSLKEIYRNAPLLKELRDPDLLKGRCGICPFRSICGGSRSRAYAVRGDYLEEDDCCSYQPSKLAVKR
ncbi:MAG: hypothetical protein A3G33_10560 [Omnitrophica bacterium RIFCSPLOWO2_12_FULL_44_17]|uniref:Radical SAM core domain-containing protein n=1 Tax=Candidatus Danuiimicrobium aquiferis TaxID=1801832 RepID=A0A1G1KRE1_9BACT|nr:MAG: hypothetical protein A3B72_02875 [Omnitrophica bacterium RIFCSPHIGHO2_02_FULL_45_28]OGW88445.1 MAG: hypothetical protein A3E74_08235 [Omnitrophica bacterium RIFCSPHIGHO2_12_FULL_44_12]OGW95483.1 MAG: hypothetical protein A3G33_10560 [Omnitrophica bacterium RIFCSPLOWO2_12_FULL_44_17]